MSSVDRINRVFERLGRREITEKEAAELLVAEMNRDGLLGNLILVAVALVGLIGIVGAAWRGLHG